MTFLCLNGCGRERKPRHLFCIYCWLLLPAQIQAEAKLTFGRSLKSDWITVLQRARAAVKEFHTQRPTGQTLRHQ